MKRSHTLSSPLLILLPMLLAGCSGQPERVAVEEGSSNVVSVNEAEQQEQLVTSSPVEASGARSDISISIVAVGDTMLGTDFPDNRLPANSGRQLMAGVASVIESADIAFANLEGGLFSGGEAAKMCRNPALCYLFRSPPHYVERFTEVGFDVVSLANNHARDFGEEGRTETMATLDGAGILHSGRRDDIASWQVDGLRVAMIAFAPFVGAHPMHDEEYTSAAVSQLAKSHDLVIVSVHGGGEGREAMNLPFAEEFYHGENRGDIVAFAHRAVDAGADLVVGHGPHVPRAMEVYRGRLIAYSLGNFTTYRGFRISGENGLAPILKVEVNGNGEFVQGEIVSAYQSRPAGTRLDPKHRAARLIGRLTREDFPDGELVVSPTGKLTITASPVGLPMTSAP